MTTVSIPEIQRYVRLTCDIEFRWQANTSMPLVMQTSLWAYCHRQVFESGTLCKVIAVVHQRFRGSHEALLHPVGHENLHADVSSHGFKDLSPLVLLAMQADATSEFDGV